MFHVLTLSKYVSNSMHMLQYDPPELREDTTYEEFPVCLLARETSELRNHSIPYVKVHWSNHNKREATWALESKMCDEYPYLFPESN